MSVEIEIRNEMTSEVARWSVAHGVDFVGGWRTWDLEFLHNLKAMNKTRRSLRSLAYDFNFLILLKDKKAAADRAAAAITPDPQAINVVYTNNVTSDKNWLPMNPWIMAHRIGHAVTTNMAKLFDHQHDVNEGPEAQLFLGLEGLWVDTFEVPLRVALREGTIDHRKSVLKMTSERGGFYSMGAPQVDRIGFLATYLFTMKSARERMISNELDIFAEALAQFLITGRFRLNRWDQTGLGELAHTRNYKKHSCAQMNWGRGLNTELTPRISVEEFDRRVDALEQDINIRMKTLCDRMVGRVIAF